MPKGTVAPQTLPIGLPTVSKNSTKQMKDNEQTINNFICDSFIIQITLKILHNDVGFLSFIPLSLMTALICVVDMSVSLTNLKKNIKLK